MTGLGAMMSFDTVGGALSAHARNAPNRIAYRDVRSDQTFTYAELDDRANRLANALIGSGLTPGARLATWMHTSLDYVELYMAAAKAGLVVTPINEHFKQAEAGYQLENSDASALVYSETIAPAVEGLISPGDLPLLISTGAAPAGAVSLESLRAGGHPGAPAGPQPDDPFMIAYTSGTTGFPKGAVLTHRSVRATARMNALSYRLPMASVGAYRGSMSFVATVCAFLMSHLHVGGTIVMLDSSDPEFIVDAIARHSCTYTSIPAPMLDGFADALLANAEALRSLVTVLHGASKAPADQLRRFAEVVGPRFLEGWGMTEHSGGLATATTQLDVLGKSESSRDVFESVGRAVPTAVVELVDGDRQPIAHDGTSVGELAIASPAVADGYWADEVATAHAFVDGWYFTGDLGSIDEAGYVYVSDRRSDLIVTGGVNVYPSEVERVVASFDGVRDVVVVGLPHEKWGQTVVAVVVAEAGSVLSGEGIIDACRDRMASFKKPTRVVFVDALPRTVSDKVKRHEVRSLVERLSSPDHRGQVS